MDTKQLFHLQSELFVDWYLYFPAVVAAAAAIVATIVVVVVVVKILGVDSTLAQFQVDRPHSILVFFVMQFAFSFQPLTWMERTKA